MGRILGSLRDRESMGGLMFMEQKASRSTKCVKGSQGPGYNGH